jgi:arylsulfatase
MRGKRLPERSIGFDHQAAHALRQGNWKLVWSKRMPHEIQWELYNLAKDRCEVDDLAPVHADRVKEMAAEWEKWARHVNVIYEADTRAQKPESPHIANRPLTISGAAMCERGIGVIVAQGGREHGYAVHLLEGKLAFDVRIDAKVTRIVSEEPVSKAFAFEAKLTSDSMALTVDGKPVAHGESPGLIPVQPKDGMNVGHDALTAAGEYKPPNRLEGSVRNLKVETGKLRAGR